MDAKCIKTFFNVDLRKLKEHLYSRGSHGFQHNRPIADYQDCNSFARQKQNDVAPSNIDRLQNSSVSNLKGISS